MLANSHMRHGARVVVSEQLWGVVLSCHVGVGVGLNLCNQACWQQVSLPTELFCD